MTSPIISVCHLKKYFPLKRSLFWGTQGYIQAVEDVTFSIPAGSTLGLVGESGCGKSTTGKAVLRLIEATSGVIEFEGRDFIGMDRRELRSIRRFMQIIYQDPFSSLNPRLSVGEIIKEGLTIHNIGSPSEREDRTVEILKRVGLKAQQMRHFPHEFSGGQRQRIAIARALVLHPKFVVADEPVSALDVSIQAQIINLLLELQDELNLTYLLIAHDLAVVEYISDTIAVMYLGSIVETAKDKDLYSSPMHPYTQALISAIPQTDPRAKKTRIILKGDVPSPINPPAGCTFHTRCHRAMEICGRGKPPVVNLGNLHLVSCFLYV